MTSQRVFRKVDTGFLEENTRQLLVQSIFYG